MKLSRKWLSEFVDIRIEDMSDREFSEAMTLSGSKVEGFSCPGDALKNVVVGKILTMERHPDSDHMWVCSVDVGGSRPLQIVTGAQNQKEGDLVPAALDGAVLPGGAEIHTSALRGQLSEGMLCSLKELGLTVHDFPYAVEDGLFVLEEDCRPGDDIVPVIGRDDHIVEFEITPNRPDCLSVIGLAREAAVTFEKELKLHTPVIRGCGSDAGKFVSLKIENTELCTRYSARLVRNVKIGPSPKWMRERLAAGGIRPINNLVDITNYVMLEYGQPMHAFDFSCLEGGHIVVRTAREGETLTTLDGKERVLKPSMLCICDDSRPVGIAGVMGGANSEITEGTDMVLFESACFNGTSVRRTAAELNMRTDASSRFEKGLDPYMTKTAADRACELVELLGAGEVLDGCVDLFPCPPKPLTTELNAERINYILGTDISEECMADILARLGFKTEGRKVTVPSWRMDISPTHTDNDLAEEVARIYGFGKVPATLMEECGTTQGGFSPEQKAERALGAVCRAAGCDEIITYSFISPSGFDMIRLPADSPLRSCMKILNPLGEDTSCMRTTTLPSVLGTLARNWNAGNKNVRLYDFGRVYLAREDGLADEPKRLTVGAYGDTDFYALKGIVANLLSAMRIEGAEYTAVRDNPSYHPGRCASVSVNGKTLGIFGQIHPEAAANYGISDNVFAAELDFPALFASRGPEPLCRPLPKFPSVLRDIAVVCDSGIEAGELEKTIKTAAGDFLKDVTVFDVYTGAPIPAGKKSVAFSLTLRADDCTLTDDMADAEVRAVLEALASAHNAFIR